MVTLQNAENALKSVYLGTVTELLNTKVNPLLTKIEHTSSDIWGKEIRKAAKIGINGGVGAGDETGDLPPPSSTNYVQFVAQLKNLYGQIEISDKAIRASADNRGAFTDLLNAELEDLLTASKFNLGRMLYGNGIGIIDNVIFNVNADTKIPVTTPSRFIEGMVVDLYGNGTFFEKGLRVSSVDRDGGCIYVDRNITVGMGAGIYMQNSLNKEITGLDAIFNANTIYGVSKADYPALKPYQKNIGGQIDEIILQEAIDRVENLSNGKVDFIACSQDVKYAYIEYMSQYKRNIDTMELDGGFTSLSYNGVPFVYDRFIKKGQVYFLDTSAFKMHQLCDWRFLETENGKILRQNQGKPTYTATLVKYCELICDRPNAQALLTGITR